MGKSKVFNFVDDHPLFSDQYVDVVIPFYGQYEKVASLVTSLIHHTMTPHFRICLVDDASPNQDFIQYGFGQIPNLLEVRNDEQIGFGACIQKGIEALDKVRRKNQPIFKWVVIMHSDCLIKEPRWLLNLGQSMMKLKDQGIKMVAPLTNNPTVDNFKMKSSASLIPDEETDFADIVLDEEDEYLPLYCAMCHRELFNRIGHIKHYPFAGYENAEFAKRMRAYGFSQAISVKSFIYHEGDCTMKYMRRKRPDTTEQITKGNKILYLKDIQKYAQPT